MPVSSNFAICRQSFAACLTLEFPRNLLADRNTQSLLSTSVMLPATINHFERADSESGLFRLLCCLNLGEIYCASCHTRSFGTKGYGYGLGSGVLSTDTGKAGEVVSTAPKTASINSAGSANGNGCPRCKMVVYEAEKVRAVGKVRISLPDLLHILIC